MAFQLDPDVDGSVDGEVYEDRETLKPGTYHLGLSEAYVASWKPEDAFRELYQNWKDGILTSFDIHSRRFKPTLQELSGEIRITMHHPDSGELLGYIRFVKRSGKLEITNFKAGLELQNLNLGGTTKQGNNQVAGTHGEGFKVAALVFLREKHSVRVTATSHTWTFAMQGTINPMLVCRVRKPATESLGKWRVDYGKKVAEGVERDLEANIWEDVSFTVSKAWGGGGKAIYSDDFRKWLAVTLDINPPDPKDIIQTDAGDLLLDPRFHGRVFLKGLRLLHNKSTDKQYQFGYNLLSGRVNRDRESMADPVEEGKLLTAIWASAIKGRGDKIIPQYIQLFKDHPACCDIRLAKRTLSGSTAQAIWRYMEKTANGRFYFDERAGHKASDRVVRGLKMKPEPLPKQLWDILKSYGLVRTPEEQIKYLFLSSPPAKLKETPFSLGVRRALEACLSSDQRTILDLVRFVQSSSTEIDLHYQMNQNRQLVNILRIHEKWLDYQQIHKSFPCALTSLEVSTEIGETHVCNHIVEELYSLALMEIFPAKFGSNVNHDQEIQKLRHRARFMLDQTPRMVEITRTENARGLMVTWTDEESRLISEKCEPEFHVILHDGAECSASRNDIIDDDEDHRLDDDYASCGCTHMYTSERNAVFKSLDPGIAYFPMVARGRYGGFCGVPPQAVKPRTYASSSVRMRRFLRTANQQHGCPFSTATAAANWELLSPFTQPLPEGNLDHILDLEGEAPGNLEFEWGPRAELMIETRPRKKARRE